MPEIPEVETAFLSLVSGEPLSTAEIISSLKTYFNLSSAQIECFTACGRQRKFDNRVIYVRTKLIREGKLSMDKYKNVWMKSH